MEHPRCAHITPRKLSFKKRGEMIRSLLKLGEIAYNNIFDAYYCVHCYEWLEKKCTDKLCKFCTERPDKAPIVGMPNPYRWITTSTSGNSNFTVTT